MSRYSLTYGDRTRTAVITCDNECTQSFAFILADPVDIRTYAAVHGWTVDGDHDYCPRCSA